MEAVLFYAMDDLRSCVNAIREIIFFCIYDLR